MLRVTSLLSMCALAFGCAAETAPDIGAQNQEAAQEAIIDFLPDGKVKYKGKTYADGTEWAQSEAFRQDGLRCGTRQPQIANFGPPGSPDDCTFSNTNIDPVYNPGTILRIPVIWHAIERTDGTGFVSDEQIHSQIDILNEDFRAMVGTPGNPENPMFPSIDTTFEFFLTDVDEDGNPHTGINRVISNDYFTDPGGAPNDMKIALYWDNNRFLNIYSNDAAGNLGYAYFPVWVEQPTDPHDGIVLLWNSVGRDAPLAPYDQGRTATHEVGHYLGLFHTFQGGCSDPANPYTSGDLIQDTVPEGGPYFGCGVAPANSCGSGQPQPIENYMDYSDDACMFRFSDEQANRMVCSTLWYRPDLFVVGGEAPTPGFDFAVINLDVTFTDTSTDDGVITTWEWDFGDGTPNSPMQNPIHTYASSGVYTVRLTVTDDDANVRFVEREVVAGNPPTAGFTFVTNGLVADFTDTSVEGDGTIIQWDWNFGDGGTSFIQSPIHAYGAPGIYTVTLTVTDEGGLPSTFATDVTIGDSPEASIDITSNGLLVQFYDASTTPDGAFNSWMWNFGDGNTSTERNPVHTYAAGGLYSVTLQVGTDLGATANAQRSVVVDPLPDADFTSATDGLSVAFTDISSDTEGGTIVGWSWDFGDGTGSNEQNPVHAYAYINVWNVTLWVTDNFGNVSAVTRQVESMSVGMEPDAGTGDSDAGGNPVNGGEGDGCACEVGHTQQGNSPWPAAVLFLGVGFFFLRRRMVV